MKNREQLIYEAIIRFPVGTKYISNYSITGVRTKDPIISDIKGKNFNTYNGERTIVEMSSLGALWANGEWAQVNPTEEEKELQLIREFIYKD